MTRIVHTLSAVAKALKVRPNTLSDWKRDGCPHLQKPPYDLDKIAEYKHVEIDVAPEDIDLERRKMEADIRLKEVKTELEHFRLAVRRGELVDIADTENALKDIAAAFRRELLNMENVFADRLIDVQSRDKVKTVLHEIAVDMLGRLNVGKESSRKR
jgi:phage terminase Nu1 subunit (DNA packaging protein)